MLRHLDELPEHGSFKVQVGEIRVEEDRAKVLVLNRVDLESLK